MPKLRRGEPAPAFEARTPSNPRFAFHTAAGRPILLVFLGTPAGAAAARLVKEVGELRSAFNDRDLALFYVANDERAIERLGIAQALPGIRYFLDFDGRISAQLGFSTTDGASGSGLIETGAVLLDRALRGLETVVVADDDDRPVIAPLIERVRKLAAWEASAPNVNHAPVLVAERIFEPAFCRALIEYYERHGGNDSGFMRERDGLTVLELDHEVKRRTDCSIEDERIRRAANARVSGLLRPLIHRAFQFSATRMERHLVCRYDSMHGGFFSPHRDNTTKGTAHRRFAVTINLNAEEYEGGDLRFPEFGPQAYRAPTGGAIVFSCSLLHEALPVTTGTRYAYLPFLYGEEDAALRERNRAFLADQTLRG
ncbi:hypothetical protein BH10PSE6_BH10PSE6_10390 [soil metagenome]